MNGSGRHVKLACGSHQQNLPKLLIIHHALSLSLPSRRLPRKIIDCKSLRVSALENAEARPNELAGVVGKQVLCFCYEVGLFRWSCQRNHKPSITSYYLRQTDGLAERRRLRRPIELASARGRARAIKRALNNSVGRARAKLRYHE